MPKKQAQSQGRNKFTKEDDEILLRMIREQHEIAAAQGRPVKDLDGNKVFQDLEAKARSWPLRDIFTYVYTYTMSH